MPNGSGLLGHPSSTQSGVIVKKPGSTSIYYIFTVDATALPNGIRWSEVDMTLAAGLGNVTANKNILLNTPSTEKIYAVRHCNNVDTWVVTHDWGTNQFRTYSVTAAGVNPVPVLSSSGTVHSGSLWSTNGYMKGSPDGTKLALAVITGAGTGGYFELFDFDNTMGTVSNPINLGAITTLAYGVEFSPNSTLLYGSSFQVIPANGVITQWNLCAGSAAAIIASATQIGKIGRASCRERV